MLLGCRLPPTPAPSRVLSDEQVAFDLPTFELAERVSGALGLVLQTVNVPAADGSGREDTAQLRAALYLGILAGRSMRAIMALLRVGYGAEAFVFARRLVEIYARVERVLDEKNGPAQAAAWLKGGDRKPSSVVDVPDWYWHGMGRVAHADHRAVEQHLIRERPDGKADFMMLPMRDIALSNTTLVEASARTLEVAYRIAEHLGHRIEAYAEIEAELLAAAKSWLAPAEA
jgi:hypothetical protein